MIRKNIKPFLRKYFLFLIPLFLLILYFLYPIPVAMFNSLSQNINDKKEIEQIITKYESQKAIYGNVSPKEIVKQWRENCIKECSNERSKSDYFSLSPKEICEIRCKGSYEGDAVTYISYSEGDIEKLKNTSYTRLFFKNFKQNITSIYQELTKKFYFQNIVIILLGLIVYYGIIFGITITRRLEKQK